jgi:hypothetical protein
VANRPSCWPSRCCRLAPAVADPQLWAELASVGLDGRQPPYERVLHGTADRARPPPQQARAGRLPLHWDEATGGAAAGTADTQPNTRRYTPLDLARHPTWPQCRKQRIRRGGRRFLCVHGGCEVLPWCSSDANWQISYEPGGSPRVRCPQPGHGQAARVGVSSATEAKAPGNNGSQRGRPLPCMRWKGPPSPAVPTVRSLGPRIRGTRHHRSAEPRRTPVDSVPASPEGAFRGRLADRVDPVANSGLQVLALANSRSLVLADPEVSP